MIVKFIKKNKKVFFSILFVFLITLITGRTLFSNQLARTDDLELHGVRVANYYLALKQGQFPPYWGPNLYYGFGYPIFAFSYHTPYLISTIFYILGFSVEQSTNMLLLSTLIIGSFGSFALSYQKNKKHLLAITSSILYLSAPYILMNYFVRGALGEITFISLVPWVIWLINMKKYAIKWWYKTISVITFVSITLSHPLSLIILAPIIFFYMMIIGFKKFSYSFYLSSIISVLISSFAWLPMILEKKFTVSATHSINQNFISRFPNLITLFYSKWGYGGADSSVINDVMPTTFGFSIILIILVSIFLILKTQDKEKIKKEIFWTTTFLISLFLMTPMSKNIWHISKVLPYTQYPWRLLWVSIFSAIVLINSSLFIKKTNKKTKTFIFSFIFLGAIFNISQFAKPLSYISNTDHQWKQHPSSSTSDNELKPIWFNENDNLTLDKKIYLRTDDEITEYYPTNLIWTGSKMTYEIIAEQNSDVLQKTLYFPGWEVKVNGVETPIKYQDKQFKGRVIFPISKGKNNIEVKITNNTFAKKLSIYLTVSGIILWGILIITPLKKFKF
jgi:hypothetical protein